MTITDTVKNMFSSTELRTLNDLFVDMLKDVYDAEQQIYSALPKMRDQATSTQLQQAFEIHRTETGTQIERLEQVFRMLDMDPEGKTCEATEGLISEAEEVMDDADDGVMDAALAASAQAVEHYEIARYGTLHAWAQELGMPQAAALLEKTLMEEKATNDKLTKLATTQLNSAANTDTVRPGTRAGSASHR